MVRAANRYPGRGGLYLIVTAIEGADPAGDGPECSRKKRNDGPVFGVAVRTVGFDLHPGIRPHCDEPLVFGEHLQFAVGAGADRIAFLDGISDMRNARLSLVVYDSDDALDDLDMCERGRRRGGGAEG